MSSRTRPTASPRSLPSFLNPVPAEDGTDRRLADNEFPELWRYYEPLVRKLVARALSRVSLHKAEEMAAGDGTVRGLLAHVGAVRETLLRDHGLQQELVQEVVIVFARAISAGRGIAAAAPVVEGWLRTTVKLTVRRKVQGPAMLRFAAGEPRVEDDDGIGDPGEAATTTTPEDLLRRRERFAEVTARLSSRELAVLKARLDGWTHAEIAELLEASRQAVRCIFCRALKKVGIKLPRKQRRAAPRSPDSKATTRRRRARPPRTAPGRVYAFD
jgi:RNA polymerase sigma factor (sigma-70 family)